MQGTGSGQGKTHGKSTLKGWRTRVQRKVDRRNRGLNEVANRAEDASPQNQTSTAGVRAPDVKRRIENIEKMLETFQLSINPTEGQRVNPSASQNPPNPRRQPTFSPPPRQDPSGDTEAQPFEPTLQQLFYMLHDDSVQTRFMQASALLKPLKGNEGRTQVESYFRHFESMTYGWSSNRRANLLATHLEGQARLVYESLSEEYKQNYDVIKACVTQGGSNAQSLRSKAQNELMCGMRQAQGENLMDFGLRVLATVRDSMLPGTPEEVIEDVASGHLLRSLGDPTIHMVLMSQKAQYSYHQLLDQAVMLKESTDATFGPRPQSPPIRPDECPPYAGDYRERTAHFMPIPPNAYRQPSSQRRVASQRPNQWQGYAYPPPPGYQQQSMPHRQSPVDIAPRTGQTQRASGRNATANAVKPEDPTRGLIRTVLGGSANESSSKPYCPTVVVQASSPEDKSTKRRQDLPHSGSVQVSDRVESGMLNVPVRVPATVTEPSQVPASSLPAASSPPTSNASPPTSSNKVAVEKDSQAKTYNEPHVAFLHSPIASTFDGQFEKETFEDAQAMGRIVSSAQFTDSVKQVLVTLPPANGEDYGQIISALLDHFASFPHVRFFIVPPPPIKNAAYESAIEQLTRAFGCASHANIVRLEHRLRSFYSVGWKAASTSTDQFHSTHDGRWTSTGLEAIHKFLDESMMLQWPFRVSYRESKREKRQACKTRPRPNTPIQRTVHYESPPTPRLHLPPEHPHREFYRTQRVFASTAQTEARPRLVPTWNGPMSAGPTTTARASTVIVSALAASHLASALSSPVPIGSVT